MGNNTSLVLYTDYAQHWKLLSGDEVKALDLALFHYVETGELPEFSGALQMAFSFVRGNIDRDKAKYDESKRAREGAARNAANVRWGNAKACE